MSTAYCLLFSDTSIARYAVVVAVVVVVVVVLIWHNYDISYFQICFVIIVVNRRCIFNCEHVYTFQILISMMLGWSMCGILTYAGYFPDDKTNVMFNARTDARSNIIRDSSWFYLPHPGLYTCVFYSDIRRGFIDLAPIFLLSVSFSIGRCWVDSHYKHGCHNNFVKPETPTSQTILNIPVHTHAN